jgi:hypothetical protein
MLLKLMMLPRPRSTSPGANARREKAAPGEPPFISGMLRSWEERYGATIIEVAPGMTRLSVARPPTDPDQSQQLAARNPGLPRHQRRDHHAIPRGHRR